MMLSPTLIASVLLSAQTPLFMQATEVNLRAQPERGTTVVGKVRIGARCERVEDKGDWVRVRCGEHAGWTLGKFFAERAPDFDALLAQAKGSTDIKARLQAASRATALRPDDKDARAQLREAFFDSEFDLGARIAAKNKSLREDELRPSCTKALVDCLRPYLDAGGFKWQHIRTKEGRFVDVQQRKDRLHITRGDARLVGGRLVASVSSRGDYTANAELVAALQHGRPSKQARYSGVSSSSLKALRRIQGDYSKLEGKPGAYMISRYCEAETPSVSVMRKTSLQPVYQLYEGYGQDGDVVDVLGARGDGAAVLVDVQRALRAGNPVRFARERGTLWRIGDAAYARGGKGFPEDQEDCSYLDEER